MSVTHPHAVHARPVVYYRPGMLNSPSTYHHTSLFHRLMPVLVAIFLIKSILLVAFYYFYILKGGHQMIPAMRDQFDYLTDIVAINDNIYTIFAFDGEYDSNNTLYARVVGLLGWPLRGLEAPIVSAVLVNGMMHIIAGFAFTRLYMRQGGIHPRVFFAVLCLSPTITAYSFFALRDVMIVALYGYFLYSMFASNYLPATIATALMLFIRPLFVAYSLFAAFLIRVTAYIVHSRNKGMTTVFAIIALVIMSYLILHIYDAFFVFNLFDRADFEVSSALFSTLGYGAFFAGDFGAADSTLAGRGARIQARIMMIDSIVLPTIFLIASIYLFRRGSPKNKQVLLVTLLLLMALSFSYLSIQGNFPFRKLLPVFPLFYVCIFLAYEQYRAGRRARAHAHAQRTPPHFSMQAPPVESDGQGIVPPRL